MERALGPEDPPPAALVAALRADPAVAEVVATDTVLLWRRREPAAPPGSAPAPGRRPAMAMPAGRPAAPAPTGAPLRHHLPVRYGGLDLDEVARALGWTTAEVVAAHVAGPHRVAFCGFVPGFAYLDGLDPRLALPRRRSPRPRVPPGAVGIAGARSGVYPFATPGGWNLLGVVEGIELFDPTRGPLLTPGDELWFEARPPRRPSPREVAPGGKAGEEAGARREGGVVVRGVEAAREGAGALHGAEGLPPDGALLRLVAGPAWVMDLGAPGWAWAGLARGGAAVPEGLRRANRAVGNPEDAAGIELYGPVEVELPEGRRWADGAGALGRGGVARVAPGPGRRLAYLAVEGGVATPWVLGSAGTWTALGLGGLEGRALRPGDRLPLGPAHGLPGRLRAQGAALPVLGDDQPLRVFRAPGVPDALWDGLLGQAWRLAEPSSRVGLRLAGTPLSAPAADAPSRPMPPGAIELPPDGLPIVLGPEHPTVGGYPLLGVVDAASLATLYARATGAEVRFGGE